MKRTMLALLVLSLVAVSTICGCGKATIIYTLTTTTSAPNTTVTTATTPPTTTSVAPTTSKTANTTTTPATSTVAQTTVASSIPVSSTPATSGNDLSALLVKYAAIVNYTCNASITGTTGTTTTTQTMKEWVKPGNPTKFKMESTTDGLTSDNIYDGQHIYSYVPSTHMATLMSGTLNLLTTPNDSTYVLQYNPVYIGAKTVNGYACWGYQYTASGSSNTMWVSTQYGLLVEMDSSITVAYSNFDFSVLPDSTFQLPAGAILTTT